VSNSLLGAALIDGVAQFRVWAPAAERVTLVLESALTREIALQREPVNGNRGGYFSVAVPGLTAGTRYRLRLDDRGPFPDPCSRYQPDGPHGASCLVDGSSFEWSDSHWPGIDMHGQVIYEMHIGTFTAEGTFDAAIAELDELAALGVTVLEIMPVAEFPGKWNWGYDGVQMFAPFHGYGDYDAFKRFVNAAHQRKLAVILDVVYNHFGPDGNYLEQFSEDYFTDRHANDWGRSLNFDGNNSHGAREIFIENARYWMRDFHLDGLRLDATQAILDDSEPHILTQIVQAARAAAGTRKIIITAENEPQDSRLMLPIDQGGCGFDAMWNDDFHHAARVAMTGSHDGYYHDYRGTAQELISAVKRGFLYQGQYYHWQRQRRGRPVTTQPASSFITFIQNHDQVANTSVGERLPALTSPARARAMTALLLLGPGTPLLFMGQEFGTRNLFTFFADHAPELRKAAHAGRREFLRQFASYASESAQAAILDPGDPATFARCKLDFAERERNAPCYQMHKDLLQLRREDPVIAAQDRDAIDGAVLGQHAFALRWFDESHGDRLLLVNLGAELDLIPVPEPLLAPSPASDWECAWSSEEPCYGGLGRHPPYTEHRWHLAAESAVLFRARPDASYE
jgi:maltooligosyltrehalose trehalohydrolase